MGQFKILAQILLFSGVALAARPEAPATTPAPAAGGTGQHQRPTASPSGAAATERLSFPLIDPATKIPGLIPFRPSESPENNLANLKTNSDFITKLAEQAFRSESIDVVLDAKTVAQFLKENEVDRDFLADPECRKRAFLGALLKNYSQNLDTLIHAYGEKPEVLGAIADDYLYLATLTPEPGAAASVLFSKLLMAFKQEQVAVPPSLQEVLMSLLVPGYAADSLQQRETLRNWLLQLQQEKKDIPLGSTVRAAIGYLDRGASPHLTALNDPKVCGWPAGRDAFMSQRSAANVKYATGLDQIIKAPSKNSLVDEAQARADAASSPFPERVPAADSHASQLHMLGIPVATELRKGLLKNDIEAFNSLDALVSADEQSHAFSEGDEQGKWRRVNRGVTSGQNEDEKFISRRQAVCEELKKNYAYFMGAVTLTKPLPGKRPPFRPTGIIPYRYENEKAFWGELESPYFTKHWNTWAIEVGPAEHRRAIEDFVSFSELGHLSDALCNPKLISPSHREVLRGWIVKQIEANPAHRDRLSAMLIALEDPKDLSTEVKNYDMQAVLEFYQEEADLRKKASSLQRYLVDEVARQAAAKGHYLSRDARLAILKLSAEDAKRLAILVGPGNAINAALHEFGQLLASKFDSKKLKEMTDSWMPVEFPKAGSAPEAVARFQSHAAQWSERLKGSKEWTREQLAQFFDAYMKERTGQSLTQKYGIVAYDEHARAAKASDAEIRLVVAQLAKDAQGAVQPFVAPQEAPRPEGQPLAGPALPLELVTKLTREQRARIKSGAVPKTGAEIKARKPELINRANELAASYDTIQQEILALEADCHECSMQLSEDLKVRQSEYLARLKELSKLYNEEIEAIANALNLPRVRIAGEHASFPARRVAPANTPTHRAIYSQRLGEGGKEVMADLVPVTDEQKATFKKLRFWEVQEYCTGLQTEVAQTHAAPLGGTNVTLADYRSKASRQALLEYQTLCQSRPEYQGKVTHAYNIASSIANGRTDGGRKLAKEKWTEDDYLDALANFEFRNERSKQYFATREEYFSKFPGTSSGVALPDPKTIKTVDDLKKLPLGKLSLEEVRKFLAPLRYAEIARLDNLLSSYARQSLSDRNLIRDLGRFHAYASETVGNKRHQTGEKFAQFVAPWKSNGSPSYYHLQMAQRNLQLTSDDMRDFATLMNDWEALPRYGIKDPRVSDAVRDYLKFPPQVWEFSKKTRDALALAESEVKRLETEATSWSTWAANREPIIRKKQKQIQEETVPLLRDTLRRLHEMPPTALASEWLGYQRGIADIDSFDANKLETHLTSVTGLGPKPTAPEESSAEAFLARTQAAISLYLRRVLEEHVPDREQRKQNMVDMYPTHILESHQGSTRNRRIALSGLRSIRESLMEIYTSVSQGGEINWDALKKYYQERSASSYVDLQQTLKALQLAQRATLIPQKSLRNKLAKEALAKLIRTLDLTLLLDPDTNATTTKIPIALAKVTDEEYQDVLNQEVGGEKKKPAEFKDWSEWLFNKYQLGVPATSRAALYHLPEGARSILRQRAEEALREGASREAQDRFAKFLLNPSAHDLIMTSAEDGQSLSPRMTQTIGGEAFRDQGRTPKAIKSGGVQPEKWTAEDAREVRDWAAKRLAFVMDSPDANTPQGKRITDAMTMLYQTADRRHAGAKGGSSPEGFKDLMNSNSLFVPQELRTQLYDEETIKNKVANQDHAADPSLPKAAPRLELIQSRLEKFMNGRGRTFPLKSRLALWKLSEAESPKLLEELEHLGDIVAEHEKSPLSPEKLEILERALVNLDPQEIPEVLTAISPERRLLVERAAADSQFRALVNETTQAVSQAKPPQTDPLRAQLTRFPLSERGFEYLLQYSRYRTGQATALRSTAEEQLKDIENEIAAQVALELHNEAERKKAELELDPNPKKWTKSQKAKVAAIEKEETTAVSRLQGMLNPHADAAANEKSGKLALKRARYIHDPSVEEGSQNAILIFAQNQTVESIKECQQNTLLKSNPALLSMQDSARKSVSATRLQRRQILDRLRTVESEQLYLAGDGGRMDQLDRVIREYERAGSAMADFVSLNRKELTQLEKDLVNLEEEKARLAREYADLGKVLDKALESTKAAVTQHQESVRKELQACEQKADSEAERILKAYQAENKSWKPGAEEKQLAKEALASYIKAREELRHHVDLRTVWEENEDSCLKRLKGGTAKTIGENTLATEFGSADFDSVAFQEHTQPVLDVIQIGRNGFVPPEGFLVTDYFNAVVKACEHRAAQKSQHKDDLALIAKRGIYFDGTSFDFSKANLAGMSDQEQASFRDAFERMTPITQDKLNGWTQFNRQVQDSYVDSGRSGLVRINDHTAMTVEPTSDGYTARYVSIEAKPGEKEIYESAIADNPNLSPSFSNCTAEPMQRVRDNPNLISPVLRAQASAICLEKNMAAIAPLIERWISANNYINLGVFTLNHWKDLFGSDGPFAKAGAEVQQLRNLIDQDLRILREYGDLDIDHPTRGRIVAREYARSIENQVTYSLRTDLAMAEAKISQDDRARIRGIVTTVALTLVGGPGGALVRGAAAGMARVGLGWGARALLTAQAGIASAASTRFGMLAHGALNGYKMGWTFGGINTVASQRIYSQWVLDHDKSEWGNRVAASASADGTFHYQEVGLVPPVGMDVNNDGRLSKVEVENFVPQNRRASELVDNAHYMGMMFAISSPLGSAFGRLGLPKMIATPLGVGIGGLAQDVMMNRTASLEDSMWGAGDAMAYSFPADDAAARWANRYFKGGSVAGVGAAMGISLSVNVGFDCIMGYQTHSRDRARKGQEGGFVDQTFGAANTPMEACWKNVLSGIGSSINAARNSAIGAPREIAEAEVPKGIPMDEYYRADVALRWIGKDMLSNRSSMQEFTTAVYRSMNNRRVIEVLKNPDNPHGDELLKMTGLKDRAELIKEMEVWTGTGLTLRNPRHWWRKSNGNTDFSSFLAYLRSQGKMPVQ